MIGGVAIAAIAVLRLGNKSTYLADDPRAQPSFQIGVTAFGVVFGVFLFAYGAIRLVQALLNRQDADLVGNERQRRKQVSDEYGALFASASDLFFRIDPMGINFGDNADEYEPEVGTVLPRLESAGSVEDCKQIVREEFAVWFDGVQLDAERTDPIAVELWSLWQAWHSRPTG